jgi:hypothetical protein
VTVWTVERDERGWSVVGPEGTRRSMSGLACITARVLAAELNGAYLAGRRDAREELARTVFGD